jgi:hypothetical protein
MDVPEDFTVGIPHTFDWQVNLGLGSGYVNHNTPPDGVWVEVDGGGLPVPLVVRIDRTADGRFIVTGMLIGRDEHREIDWSTLRNIKPASIISMLFAGFDPRLPDKLVDETWVAEREAGSVPVTQEELDEVGGHHVDLEPGSHPAGSAEAAEFERTTREFVRALKAHDIWRMTGGRQGAVTEVSRPRASVATNLTHFAETYMSNVAADPRRATTATAEQLHISRATAIRRIKECRDLGLIPTQEKP